MKHSDTPKDFKSPYMSKVEERLNVLEMNVDARNNYFHYLKEAVSSQDAITSAKEQGREEGRYKKIKIMIPVVELINLTCL